MKLSKILIVAFVCALAAFVLVGCGGEDAGGGSDGGTESGGESAEAPSSDAESIETRLQEDYGDTAWFGAIDHITTVNKLRFPVTEIHFAATVSDVRASFQNDATEAIYALNLSNFYVELYGTDGPAGGFGGLTAGESAPLPPSPASIDEMAAWMEQAYGPGSGDPVEDWYGHITGYDLETDAWDGERVLVVKTDFSALGSEWSPERDMVTLMRYAVAAASPTWATNSRVVDSSGENLSTGAIGNPAPYSGF